VLPPRSLIRPWAWTMLLTNANGIGLEARPHGATPRSRACPCRRANDAPDIASFDWS
jgi:hypothetical protein